VTPSATVTAAQSRTASHAEIRSPARQTSSTPSGNNAIIAASQTLPVGVRTCTNTCDFTPTTAPKPAIRITDRYPTPSDRVS
jgi:hypothetical protein